MKKNENKKPQNAEERYKKTINKTLNISLCSLITSFGLLMISSTLAGVQKNISQPERLDPVVYTTAALATVGWIGTCAGTLISIDKAGKKYENEIGKERHM